MAKSDSKACFLRGFTTAVVAATVAAAGISGSGLALAKQDSGEWVTICHRTNSTKNPYVAITVKQSAVDGSNGKGAGQGDHYGQHTGPVWEASMPNGGDWGDIIPPVPGFHNGRNWTPQGKAILEAGCHAVSVVPEEWRDTDKDGQPDSVDVDDDGDGLFDVSDPTSEDDGDGIPDAQDPDDDGDGVSDVSDPDDDGDGTPDAQDPDADSDGDGVPNAVDPDADGDSVSDAQESDSDGDNLPDFMDRDDDNDGMPDAMDVDDDGDGVSDVRDESHDNDNDSIPDYADSDDDNDGLSDQTDSDVDGDGISDAADPDADPDGDELPNALDGDNDNDGESDRKESDLDGDGIPDYRDSDDDGDGIPDSVDTDRDGDDRTDDTANPDSDRDGLPDASDPDDDQDGIRDRQDRDSNGDGLGETENQVATPKAPKRVRPGIPVTFGSPNAATNMGMDIAYRVTCNGRDVTEMRARGGLNDSPRPICTVETNGSSVSVRVLTTKKVVLRVTASSSAVANSRGYHSTYAFQVG